METRQPTSNASRHGGPRLSRFRPVVLVVLWLVAVLGGSAAMLHYEFSSGGDVPAPEHWPVASRISRAADRATLVVFAHPRCPCTSATFDELAGVLAKAGSGAVVHVVFFTPPDPGLEWTQAPAVLRAAAIPGVTALSDESGNEARIFHAATSGRTLLYNPEGELLFDGGITGSRGHTGENAGANALLTLLKQGGAPRGAAAVFGCPILSHAAAPDSSTCRR